MVHKPVVIVDDDDNVVGAAELEKVWREGLKHRIVRTMVEDEDGRVLLQKRSRHMELYPDCWDHSAAGHVDDGDTYEQAAQRELQEELGISGFPLKEIASYPTNGEFKGRKLNRFNKLYVAVVPKDQHFAFDEHEVGEVRWFTKAEIRTLMQEHPEQVTDGLVQIFGKHYHI